MEKKKKILNQVVIQQRAREYEKINEKIFVWHNSKETQEINYMFCNKSITKK